MPSVERKLNQRVNINDLLDRQPQKQMLHLNPLQVENYSIANEYSSIRRI